MSESVDHREFLKVAGATSVAAAVPGSGVFGKDAQKALLPTRVLGGTGARVTAAAFAPDLAVDAVCPSDRDSCLGEKIQPWLAAGVRFVRVVSPRDRRVTVYRPGTDPRVLTRGNALDGEDAVPGFRLVIDELWS